MALIILSTVSGTYFVGLPPLLPFTPPSLYLLAQSLSGGRHGLRVLMSQPRSPHLCPSHSTLVLNSQPLSALCPILQSHQTQSRQAHKCGSLNPLRPREA